MVALGLLGEAVPFSEAAPGPKVVEKVEMYLLAVTLAHPTGAAAHAPTAYRAARSAGALAVADPGRARLAAGDVRGVVE